MCICCCVEQCACTRCFTSSSSVFCVLSEPSEFDDMTIDALREQVRLFRSVFLSLLFRHSVILSSVIPSWHAGRGVSVLPFLTHPSRSIRSRNSKPEKTEHDLTATKCRCVAPLPSRHHGCRAWGLPPPPRFPLQLDRDTIQTFFDITKKSVDEVSLKIASMDREMELMEDNHRVEVRVYVQKVKHLEYEHSHALKRIEGDTKDLLQEETDVHRDREAELRKGKTSLKMELAEREHEYATEIKDMKLLHAKNLSKLQEEFADNMAALTERYDKRLRKMKYDLALRRKVEVHEIEERKNLHINDLMTSHDNAFKEIKKYYNDITKDNLKLIRLLKNQIAELHRTQAANQKLTIDIAQENKNLSEPLAVATEEVAGLRADLRDAEKDRMSLRNARARLQALDREIQTLAGKQAELEAEYAAVEGERDSLYKEFESTVAAVARHSDFKNVLLEKKLADLGADFESRQATLNEVLVAANLDPAALALVSERLDSLLDVRNRMIRDLQYQVARVTKAHNDAMRVYEEKLREMGVAVEETGFSSIPTTTGVGPAGLVAVPKF